MYIIVMNKKNNNTYILLFIIIVLLIVIIYFLTKKKNKEYFDESTSEMSDNFQLGKSGITPTGTINFQTPFSKPPLIFTQIVSSSADSANSYSIQVFNITNNGFDYSKNKIYNSQTTAKISSEENTTYTVTLMTQSTTEPFIWLAISYTD
jgi:hypothetical protein